MSLFREADSLCCMAARTRNGLSAEITQESRDVCGPGPRSALWLAGACVIAMVLVWAVADLVPAARSLDVHLLGKLTALSAHRQHIGTPARAGPHVEGTLNALVDLVNPTLYALWVALIIAVALIYRRARLAIAVAAVMVLAPLSAELLKPLVALNHEQLGYLGVGPEAWPSGHATAALALALCAVLVAPARARATVAVLGALGALALGCALVILEVHMASDVIGGYLVAVLWAALALAALRAANRRWPPRSQSHLPVT